MMQGPLNASKLRERYEKEFLDLYGITKQQFDEGMKKAEADEANKIKAT